MHHFKCLLHFSQGIELAASVCRLSLMHVGVLCCLFSSSLSIWLYIYLIYSNFCPVSMCLCLYSAWCYCDYPHAFVDAPIVCVSVYSCCAVLTELSGCLQICSTFSWSSYLLSPPVKDWSVQANHRHTHSCHIYSCVFVLLAHSV